MSIDIATIKANCSHFVDQHYAAVEVLRKADGRTDYKEIADSINVHPTTVSSLLNEATKLGLASKEDDGKFKKTRGILQYMPKAGKKPPKKKTAQDLIKKTRKKKVKGPNSVTSSALADFKDKSSQEMAEAYLWLYTTENALRQLIRIVFKDESDWWDKRVNISIKTEAQRAMDNYPYHGANRADELEYTHLGQLKEIIVAKKNWASFDQYLEEKDKASFGATVDKAIPSRNSLAHCTPLTKEDLKVVRVRFEDILKMIK